MFYLGSKKLKNLCINNVFQKDLKIGDNYLFEEKKTVSGSEVASLIIPAVRTGEVPASSSAYPENTFFTTPSTVLVLACDASYPIANYSTKSKYFCDSFCMNLFGYASNQIFGCNATIYLKGSLTNDVKIQIELVDSSSEQERRQSYYIYDAEGLLETYTDQRAGRFIIVKKERGSKQITFSIQDTTINKAITEYSLDEPLYLEIIQKHTSKLRDDRCYIGNINYIDDLQQINS